MQKESYDRFAYFDLPSTGYNMYQAAIDIYDDPGTYFIVGRQCDDIACELLRLGGIDIDSKVTPNQTYKSLTTSKWTVKDN